MDHAVEDERAFVTLREVLAGRRRLRLDARASKMLRILFSASASEAEITAERFVVHRGDTKQRRPSSYERRLAPPVVSELLVRASVDVVTSPVVIGLPEDAVGAASDTSWRHGPALVWIVPDEHAVKLLVRTSPERWRAPFVEAIPASGPLALRELPAWSPDVRYLDLERALACAACGVAATRYRDLGSALVCLRCSRSFVRAP
jgi:hypothetical protein